MSQSLGSLVRPLAASRLRAHHATQESPYSAAYQPNTKHQRRRRDFDSILARSQIANVAIPVRPFPYPSRRKGYTTLRLHCSASSATPSHVAPDPQPFERGLAVLFPILAISASAAVHKQPSLISWLTNDILVGGLVLSMLGLGASMEKEDWNRLGGIFGVASISAFCQFVVMLTLAISVGNVAGLSNAACIGLSLVACCSGGPASGIGALISRGDAALSTGLTITTTLLAVISIPWMTSAIASVNSTVPALTTSAVFKPAAFLVLLPILAGGALRMFGHPTVSSAVKNTGRLTGVVMISIVSALAFASCSTEVMKQELSNRLLGCIAAMHAGGFVLGYVLPRIILRIPGQVAQSFSMTTGMQNSSAALMLATVLSSSGQAGILAPIVASICISSLMGSLFAALFAVLPREKSFPPMSQDIPENPNSPSSPAADSGSASITPPELEPVVTDVPEPAPPSDTKTPAKDEEKAASDIKGEAAKVRAWIEAWRNKQKMAAAAAAELAPKTVTPVAPSIISIDSVSSTEPQNSVASMETPTASDGPHQDSNSPTSIAGLASDALQANAMTPQAVATSTQENVPPTPPLVQSFASGSRQNKVAEKTPAKLVAATKLKGKLAIEKVALSPAAKEKVKESVKQFFPAPADTKEAFSEASSIFFGAVSSSLVTLRDRAVDIASYDPSTANKANPKYSEQEAAKNASEARAWIAAWRRTQEAMKNAAEARAWISAWREQQIASSSVKQKAERKQFALAKGLTDAAKSSAAKITASIKIAPLDKAALQRPLVLSIPTLAEAKQSLPAPLDRALQAPKALSLPKLEDAKEGLDEASQIVVGSLSKRFKEFNADVSVAIEEANASMNALKQAIDKSSSSAAVPLATTSAYSAEEAATNVAEAQAWIAAWKREQEAQKNAAEARAWIAKWRAKPVVVKAAALKQSAKKTANVSASKFAPLKKALLKTPEIQTTKVLSLPKLQDTKDGLNEARQMIIGNFTKGLQDLNKDLSNATRAVKTVTDVQKGEE